MKGAQSKSDSELLSKLYGQLAEVATDSSASAVCKSTGDVRTLILGFATSINNANLKGKYSGLGKQLDTIMLTELGSENVYFNTETRAKAVELLNSIAWGLWEAGHQ
jgi:hypothetical protein